MRPEVIGELRELADQIYEILEEMKNILKDVAPEEYVRAKRYWMAHIDRALENRGSWLTGSAISFEDTIAALEERLEDEEFEDGEFEDEEFEDEEFEDEEE